MGRAQPAEPSPALCIEFVPTKSTPARRGGASRTTQPGTKPEIICFKFLMLTYMYLDTWNRQITSGIVYKYLRYNIFYCR